MCDVDEAHLGQAAKRLADRPSPVDASHIRRFSDYRKIYDEIPKDLDIDAKVVGMNEIIFSHKKHTVWSGCEGCHPEIFSGIKQGLTKFSMVENFEGKFCGQCHSTVAFPLIDCQRCHTKPVQ